MPFSAQLAFSIVWDPARVTGTLVYGLAAAGCLAVLLRRHPQRATWLALLCVFTLMIIDTVWNVRHELSPKFRSFLSPEQYAQRRPVQYTILLAGMLFWVVTTGLLMHKARRLSAALAIAGASLALACSIASLMSYHHLDTVTYKKLGPLPVIAWCWCVASFLTCCGVAIALRQTSANANAPASDTPT